MTGYDELRRVADEVWGGVVSAARPRLTVAVATCSRAAGVDDTLDALRSELARRGLAADLAITGCNGLCYEEPQVRVTLPGGSDVLYRRVTPERVPSLLDALEQNRTHDEALLAILASPFPNGGPTLKDDPFWAVQQRCLTARCGLIDPEDIDHYIAKGGYSGLERVLLDLSPEETIQEVLDSTLRGRSGSDFPTGRKWEFLHTARGAPKYLVCNADEGDPGAFVNRVLLESDPQSIIEGMAIAAHATGAVYGFIYIRDEYPLAVERMEKAVQQAREKGLLGGDVLGRGLAFDAEVIRGAGSYVCGEETGLIASVEDMRGMPKIRPPFPAQAGVFAKPTNVNNVETYADIGLLFRDGREQYSSVGTARNYGTKIFSLSGHIERTGVAEVSLGMPLQLLIDAAGGVPGGRPLKAVQPGGPLAGIMPAALVQGLKLEPEEFRPLHVQMGGGGIVIIDDSACIVDLCIHFERFGEEESCGRCTTCRGGAQRMVEILRRIARGEGREVDIERMRLLGDIMHNGNCVHGQATPTVVMNTLEYFMDELNVHIVERRCPAKVCRGLIRYEVTSQEGNLPEAEDICPTNAVVKGGDGSYHIDDALCIRCDACRKLAPDSIAIFDAFPA